MRNGVEIDYRAFVDAERGTVDRRIFSDQEIYETEIERIFARAWNFMCHESQIARPGDFFLNFIGEESVIATRDKKGNLQVLLNTCRHRGNAVCRAEQGRATSFLCTYHGWTYDLEGRLVGVPGYKDFYHEALDREQWGLPKAAKVASYKGFVFATMDPEAPDLEEYLGPVGRVGLDMAAERGAIVAVEGVQKNVIGCNWKLAVDNLFDWYHVQISHASAMMTPGAVGGRRNQSSDEKAGALRAQQQMMDRHHRVMIGDYGHAISGPRIPVEFQKMMPPEMVESQPSMDLRWRHRPEIAAILGEAGIESIGHPNIFPNLWIAGSGTQLSLRLPRGPFKTEIWWFTLVDSGLPQETRDTIINSANHVFGPAGVLEQEDGENWDQSTRATAGPLARRYPLNFSMNLGNGEVRRERPDTAPYIDTHINEHAQLWTYRAWADWMAADDWAALKDQHVQPPHTAV